jgi:hypothetical protein
MTRTASLIVALGLSLAPLVAQEMKPVPKGSERVGIPGCVKGRILTAIPRTEAQPGTIDIPVGMHIRMNGPGKMLKEIEARAGTVVVVTGLMKTGQLRPEGMTFGGSPLGGTIGISGAGPRTGAAPVTNQVYVDVEGWRPGVGDCPR